MRRDQAETRNADQHVAASAEHRIAQDDGVNSGIKRRDLRLDLAQPVTGMALEQLDRQGLEAIESRRAIADQVATGSAQFGQPVLLRFSAFDIRTTPEINGTVARVAADTNTDQRTGQTYYVVRIAMTPDEIARLGNVRLTPGMPVEAFIQTGQRTMLSYLIKPLHDQFMRAFRER